MSSEHYISDLISVHYNNRKLTFLSKYFFEKGYKTNNITQTIL
jgi:hypothetical protein